MKKKCKTRSLYSDTKIGSPRNVSLLVDNYSKEQIIVLSLIVKFGLRFTTCQIDIFLGLPGAVMSHYTSFRGPCIILDVDLAGANEHFAGINRFAAG